MNGDQLVTRLATALQRPKFETQDAALLAQYLQWWLDQDGHMRPSASVTVNRRFADILHYALCDLRCSERPEVVEHRIALETACGMLIPDLCSIDTNTTDRAIMMDMLKSIMSMLSLPERVWAEVDQLFDAQTSMALESFRRFLYTVYQQGLRTVIETAEGGRLYGQFGQFGVTGLHTVRTEDGVSFAFSRPELVAGREGFVSFAIEGGLLGLGAEMGRSTVALPNALAMIDDVVQGWPSNSAIQWARMNPDETGLLW